MGDRLSELFGLEGRVAVVTGASGVLGGAIARGLAAAGAQVGLLARRREHRSRSWREASAKRRSCSRPTCSTPLSSSRHGRRFSTASVTSTSS